ncbi:GntR family transcriptional regulator [Parvularcula marina]|uniref:GntR family transcriptional regulator n=1 Tax=Parvularcula marina TaxID=2292771 RepID=A0A371RLE8_9PROT|nr:GntR family transcriptional regulator [Parvularcula marina]RFB06264.1 GntR family transcriptional regulator [Parvularcula marina]
MVQSSKGKKISSTSLSLNSGPLPLYHQLENALAERLEAGEFGVDGALPTEQQIGEEYGVSRITVRRALGNLIAHGMIVRRQGVGTFVASPAENVRSVRLTGSLDEFLAKAGKLTPKFFSKEEVDPDDEIRDSLALSETEKAIRFSLVTSLAGDPVIYLQTYFPTYIGERIDVNDIAEGMPVIRLVERKLNQRAVRALQTIEPVTAEGDVAKYLCMEEGRPLLRIRRTYFRADGQPIETAILHQHPERYEYLVELTARLHAV